MEAELVAYVGSRSGSAAALAIFASLFAALGYGVQRWCHQRGWSTRAAGAAGILCWAGPLTLFYVSSIAGFYELRAYRKHVEVRYLLPAVSTRLELSDLAGVDVRFAFRGRWRLVMTAPSGHTVVSTIASREAVETAAGMVRRGPLQRDP